MVFLPALIKAAPVVTSLLSSQLTKSKDKSSQQGKFSDMLQSALNAGGASGTTSTYTQSTVKADDIKSSANAVLDAIKKKIATPAANSITPGIVNLPQSASNLLAAPDTKKLNAAGDAFNAAVAATPVKPLVEASSPSAQINMFSDNMSLVVNAAPASQNTTAGGWDRYRMDASAMNKKGGSVTLGLKMPIG
jgi:hypothetical protein